MVNMPGMTLLVFNHMFRSCSSIRIQLTGSKQTWFLSLLEQHISTFKVALPAYIAIMFILLTQCAN